MIITMEAREGCKMWSWKRDVQCNVLISIICI